MNGKGDKQRPRQVSYDEYAANWEKAFGKPVVSEVYLEETQPKPGVFQVETKQPDPEGAKVPCPHPAGWCFYSFERRAIVCGDCGEEVMTDLEAYSMRRRNKRTTDLI